MFNPTQKLKFFKTRPQFTRRWIENLTERMSQVFTTEYLRNGASDHAPQEAAPRVCFHKSQSCAHAHKLQTFAEQMLEASPVKSSSRRDAAAAVEIAWELEQYLSSGVENAPDIIAWWWQKRETYPNLYRMALDYCSAPGVQHLLTRTLADPSISHHR